MGLVPGEVLAGTSYQVVREIGSGGMGVVYEVEHVRLRKRYVAKVIHERIREDDTAAKRMEREAHVLAEINHPNVVQVHDVGTTADGTSYFVMEKLEGADLRHAMKRGSISTARAVAITIDVLDALEHVHRRGIVHRDIKPENIFLAHMANGAATKVLDFGIVHIFDGERASQARITKTGGFVGTLYYAAPEQMQGKPAGTANDVYACGLVLFEMLVGRGPFDDDPGVGLSRCFKPAPRLPESERIPSALVDAIAGALEQDSERRPDAGALARTLREVLSLLPTDPGPAVTGGVRSQVDDLLGNMALNTKNGASIGTSPTDIAMTAAPRTPLMAGAPSHPPPIASASVPREVKATAPVAYAPPGTNPGLSAHGAFGPAMSSGAAAAIAVTNAPRVDTASGVAASVVVPRGSRLAVVGALVGGLVLMGLLATVGVTALRGRTSPAVAASAAPPPPVVATPEPVAEPTSTPTPVVAPEPSPAPLVAASAAASSVAAPAPRPAAAKPHGNAEKDGYFKADDL